MTRDEALTCVLVGALPVALLVLAEWLLRRAWASWQHS